MAATVIADDLSRQATAAALCFRVPIITFPPTGATVSSTLSTVPMPEHRHQPQQQQHQLLQQEQHHHQAQPSFGICFDVDGVLAQGTVCIPEAPKAMKKLMDSRGQLRVPVTFVTNSLNRSVDRANQLKEILGVQVSAEQLIQAPCPLRMFKGLHEKFCLVVGQANVLEIAADLGFKRTCTIEDIAAAYPLLDMVDHDNRKRIARFGYEEKPLQRVEAIVLMGEPKRWESALQIILDLLRTDGKPDRTEEIASGVSTTQLPVIACNMDLQFKDRAAMPRFGHGAFLVCLEGLYKKLTGEDLKYTSLIGKPSEITFRFAEHVLTTESRRMGYSEPIKTMYLVGDTPEVDIAGSNLYQRYVDQLKERKLTNGVDPSVTIDSLIDGLPDCRIVPTDASLYPQTVEKVVPILVCTGVYTPEEENNEVDLSDGKPRHGHRDFPNSADLDQPEQICSHVEHAIDYILQKENFVS